MNSNASTYISGVIFLAFPATRLTITYEITPTAIPSEKPSKYQKDQIKRKYGMFIHFGINTFHDVEWSDGSFPVETYAPTEIDARQWVKTAKDAGMKYIILVAKHHEGFCLWDSKYTDYDVASSGIKRM